jgi:radical SAM protein with 4Fe4S-binding SPASM domain
MNYTIYLKLTNKCNLKCDHCFNEMMHNHDTMEDGIINRSVQWINDFAHNHAEDDINCQLFGGEPCLMAPEVLLDVVTRTSASNVYWSITTNLVYALNDKHIELFNLMQPYCGRSISMIQTSWDPVIRFKSNHQLTQWEDNVRTLTNNGIIVQPTICLTSALINEYTPEVIFEYLIEFGITQINFERLTHTGRAVNQTILVNKNMIPLIPTNKQIDQWLFEAFKTSKLPEYQHLRFPIFEGVEQSIKGEMLGCRARKCMQTVYTINPDGSIGGCPNTACYAPNNINAIHWVDNKLIKQEQLRNNNCLICNYYQYCNGDCFQLKHDHTGCPGMKSIYQYLLG